MARLYHGMDFFWGGAAQGIYPYDQSLLSEYRQQFAAVAGLLGASSYVYANQIHGNKGYTVTSSHDDTMIPMSDFLITQQKDIALCIITADCVPFIVYDPLTGVVALVHAGWKGIYVDIVSCVLGYMQHTYQSRMESLFVVYGPSICYRCYPVGPDFPLLSHNREKIQDYESGRGRYCDFDLQHYITQQLCSQGLLMNKIDSSFACCTFCDDGYFSYRRNGRNAGRNINAVVLR